MRDVVEKKDVVLKEDYLSFFIAPFLVLITVGIMHLMHMPAVNVFFEFPFGIIKLLFSYLFLLAFQSILCILIRNFKIVHILQTTVFFILGTVSEVLLLITGDPLLPSDFLLIGSLNKLMNLVKIIIPGGCIVALVFSAMSIAFIVIRSRCRKICIKNRVIFSAVSIILFGILTYTMCFNRIVKYRFFPKCHISITQYNPAEDYYANGFILNFFTRIGELYAEKPQGYSKDSIAEIKNRYGKMKTSAKTEAVNIIAVQSEAWWDPTLLPHTVFSGEPMPNYRRLVKSETAITGQIISPVFGGATCIPEFEFLTGLTSNFLPAGVYPYIQSVTSDVPSFILAYKNSGYKTLAIHTYEKGFYKRNTAYPLMGFDEFLGIEDMEEPEVKGLFVSDDEITKEIIKSYENKTYDKLFLFGVTMQNHGGYLWQRYSGYDVIVDNEKLSPEDLTGLRDYTQGVFDADLMLGKLIEYFEKVEEPTIICMYGDHMPLLGTNESTYKDTGYIEEEKTNYNAHPKLFSTPFVIWANYDISENDIPQKVSPAKLGLELLKLSGAKNIPWHFSVIDGFYKKYPVSKGGLAITGENEVVSGVREEDGLLKRDYQHIQYDILYGKQYVTKE